MKNKSLFCLIFVVAAFMITLNVVFTTSSHSSRNKSDLHSLQTIEHALIRSSINPIYSNNVCLIRYQHKDYTLSKEEKTRLGSYKYFIVANLKNSEKILDYFLSELIHTIKLLISVTDDPSSIFVSIFESASVDITPIVLQSFAVTLEAMGVPHDIKSDPNFKRRTNQPRIEFLANVRNRGMEPLFSPLVPNFDRIIFFNDIYFCKNDILRLLLYHADMACAMDFDGGFRDTWVMRTIDGNFLSKWPPNFDISHAESLSRLKQGKAFHVLSAWNGLVVMKPTLFYRGIQFHDGKSTSCPTSECTLLCLDMWKNNMTRIIVDPRVLVAYDYLDFERLNNKYEMPMVDVDLEVPYYEMPEEWQCCPIYGLNFDGLREDCKFQSLKEWKPK